MRRKVFLLIFLITNFVFAENDYYYVNLYEPYGKSPTYTEEITFYDTADVDISKLTVLKKLKRINVNHGSPVNCEYLADFPDLDLAYLHPAIPNDEEFAKAEKVRTETGRDIRYVK